MKKRSCQKRHSGNRPQSEAAITYLRQALVLVLLALCCQALPGCGKKSADSTDKDQNTAIVFPVEVTRAAYEVVSHSLEAVGSFAPEEEVTVGAEVAGIIKTLKVDEGSLVTKGQLLLKIDDESVRLEVQETEATLRESLAGLKNARATLERQSKLLRDHVTNQQDYDDAQTQVSLSQAGVEKLRARLDRFRKTLKDTDVLSPIDGIVSERLVAIGEYVKLGAEMLRIVDLDPLKLVFSLPETNAGEIKKGQQVSVTTRPYPGETFTGSIYYISPKVDPETRTIEVKAWVDNSDHRLKPGFFANVTVLLDKRKSLVLPESAVVVREGRVIVMAVKDGIIAYKPVTPGFRFDGKVEIQLGITQDDDIVVYGSSEITEGTPVKIIASK